MFNCLNTSEDPGANKPTVQGSVLHNVEVIYRPPPPHTSPPDKHSQPWPMKPEIGCIE